MSPIIKGAKGFIANVDGIPLYADKESALKWGKSLGIEGTHTCSYLDIEGYSGGFSRAKAKEALIPVYPKKASIKPTPPEPITIEILDNDLDRAISDAKIKGLIDEDIEHGLIKDKLITAMIEIDDYNNELEAFAKNQKPKIPKALRCNNCGNAFGKCIFRGCFAVYKWTWDF
jgi:hypothetical protein